MRASVIANSPHWKYSESQGRRLLSAKAVLSVVYSRGMDVWGKRNRGSERNAGFPLSIEEN